MEWEDGIERITEKANNIESALSHSTRTETLDALLLELRQDLTTYKHIIQSSPNGERTLAQLSTRVQALNRRVNIMKMSYNAENTREKHRMPDEDCHITRNTDKLNKYIKIASHSLSSIEKQRGILKGSRKKLEDGLQYLGLSDRVIDQISNRYITDYRIFKALTAIFILLFIYVFLLRK
ncbi:hypothetical protein NEPAR07_1402 [Nematocida parisii]|uniref:Golgi SNAP receptor complex member 1 n=1 Tax=Nematocida parisii (strain ERTm3) TaxID=935791 RepID=I3EEB1_NEMP3|nr:hypothetical protein NEQG_02105 [Nematocida parisii ERTm3]KAI5145007.1 hypothetical protein NEPAR07_1402 [Nematocida parisii]